MRVADCLGLSSVDGVHCRRYLAVRTDRDEGHSDAVEPAAFEQSDASWCSHCAGLCQTVVDRSFEWLAGGRSNGQKNPGAAASDAKERKNDGYSVKYSV